MAARIGTITGIALVPGVSRNGRLYTAEAIGRACARAQQRLAEQDAAPLTMLTHHEAGDDSSLIVGRLTALKQLPDGSAQYSADLADTDEARRIAALVDTNGGSPFLRGVSIRGAWVGKVRTERGPDGSQVQTADDLEIDGLDFTRKPGVPGARVDTFTPADAGAPAETASDGRVLITESVQEALVDTTLTEAADKGGDTSKPYGDVTYADPGYQKDKQKRYPLDTKTRAKAAWSYINQADNARLYTAAQLKRIKQRITKALKGYGVTVAAQEGWLIDPAAQVTEALAECWGMDAGDAGNLYVSLTNGPTTVTVSSYSLDPHDLDAVGRAAMDGACQALACLDPDMDADIDVPGMPGGGEPASAAGSPCPCGCGCAIPATPGGCPCGCESCMYCKTDEDAGPDDDDMESAPASPAAAVAESGAPVAAAVADGITQTPAAETPAAENPTLEEEPAMAEPNTAAETAAAPATGGVTLTDEQFKALLDRLAPAPAAQESAPAAAEEQVAEAAAPAETTVAETEEQRIARLVAEGIKAALPAAIQESVQATGPSRKGLVQPVTETSASGATVTGLPEGAPAKPLHEYTDEEWQRYVAPVTVGAILGARGAAPADAG